MFRAFLESLNAANVEYMIVGGYAVNVHGYVRNTGDLNVRIASDAENADRVVEALLAFGFAVLDVKPEIFLGENRIVQMGSEPEKIEIITYIDGPTWIEAEPNIQRVEIDGVSTRVISLDDLIRNKTASGRLRDQEDLERLPAPEA